MKKRNLKKIIKDLKSLLDELESEVYSDPDRYIHPWYQHTGDSPEDGPRYQHTGDDDGEYN
tara:strand:+ start:783 stop:965 length:183 start_codon:yes stop_codon:yes gene_type:complete